MKQSRASKVEAQHGREEPAGDGEELGLTCSNREAGTSRQYRRSLMMLPRAPCLGGRSCEAGMGPPVMQEGGGANIF